MNLKNSLCKVIPNSFHKEIFLPRSKSHSNRALILGALRGNGFQIQNLSNSSDVLSLLICLEKIGLKFVRHNDTVLFSNSFPDCENETSGEIIDLKTGDGGTTNRFLIALLSLGKKTYRIFPNEKINERPIDDLLIPLQKLGVNFAKNVNEAWLQLNGPAQLDNTSEISIDCQFSTQFASALMLAFSHQSITFKYNNVNASEVYLQMTKFILKETLFNNFYNIPVDFSSLSYPMALGLIDGRVLFKDCKVIDSFQPDSKFIELMKKSGGNIEWTEDGLLVTSINKLKPFTVDGSEFPDLVPTLVFIAANIEGTSTLSNLSVLRHKESDRLNEMVLLLKKLSIDFHFDEKNDEIIIKGKGRKVAFVNLSTARDHRIVMMAYLFLRVNSGGTLAEMDCIEKSFPDFLNIMEDFV